MILPETAASAAGAACAGAFCAGAAAGAGTPIIGMGAGMGGGQGLPSITIS